MIHNTLFETQTTDVPIPTFSLRSYFSLCETAVTHEKKGEWLKYTVYVAESGTFLVSARYSTLANSTALAITVDDGSNLECTAQSDGLILYDDALPSTGCWDVWENTEEVCLQGRRGDATKY